MPTNKNVGSTKCQQNQQEQQPAVQLPRVKESTTWYDKVKKKINTTANICCKRASLGVFRILYFMCVVSVRLIQISFSNFT